MKSKLKHLLAGALLILPLALQAFTGLQAVSAADTAPAPAPDVTKIELQKLMFNKDVKDFKLPDLTTDDSQNGKALTTLPNGATPVNGVDFTARDITSIYNSDKFAGKSAQDRADAIKSSLKNKNDDTYTDIEKIAGTKVTTGQKDGHDGIADFELANKSADGKKNAVWVIEETNSGATTAAGQTVTQTADPIVLVLPLRVQPDADGYIHMYPKNETTNTLDKDVSLSSKSTTSDMTNPDLLTADNSDAVVGLGDKVSFTITVVIPNDVATMDQFVVTDTPQFGLNDVLPATSQFTVEGNAIAETAIKSLTSTTAPADGTHPQGAGFEAQLDPAALNAYKGKTLTITYDATLNKNLIPSKDALDNTVTLNHNPGVHTHTPVTTGGAKFQKLGSDTNKGLGGAQFIVLNEAQTQYLTKIGSDEQGNAKYEWVNLPGDQNKLNENAVVLTSADTTGNFEITGLAYGTYYLRETKAPDNYALLNEPTKFTVDKGSYTNTDELKTISDAPKGILPHTGGMGIYIVIAAGLAIALAGVAFLRRGKHHEEV